MKLTNKARGEVGDLLSLATRCQNFLMQADILVGRHNKRPASTTLDFSRGNESFTSFAKDIGSELCLLWTLKDRLTKIYENGSL